MFSAYNEKYLLYLAEEKFDTALIYINKAISFLQENIPSSKEESLMNNKALIFIKSGDFNRAHEILNLCLNNTKNKYELNRTYLSLGELYLNEGNYSLSKEYLHKCLSFFKKKKNYLYAVSTLIFLSENYTSESEFVLARVSLAEARILAEKNNSLSLQKDIKKAYREIYIKKNDISALRQCDEELSLLMTTILLDDNKKLLAATRINYNELLAEKEFFINKNKKSYFFAEMFKVVLVSLFIIILLYLLRKYYQLYKIILKRESYLLHHISCVHKEDALALKAIRFDVQTSLIELGSHIKKDLPYSSFSENVVSITNKLDKSVRKLELNALGNIDFYDAIQTIVGFYIRSDKIIVNIKLEGNLVYIEYFVKLHFLNIISEFVDNTVKYSKADEIEILFQIERDKLYFSYRDDGYGVDDFDAKKSNGILDVESRVKALGAQMNLKIEKYKGMFAEIKIE